MAKTQSHKPQTQQLELRVFGQIEGGRSSKQAATCAGTRTPTTSSCEKKTASAEDQAIYKAIADRYFESDR